MEHRLSELPYELDALAPHLSLETLELHYGKHHAGYVTRLNALLEQHEGLQGLALPALTKAAREEGATGVYRCAAQALNHDLYWNSMSPAGGGAPEGALAEALEAGFGSVEDFRKAFTEAAGAHFGSGWCWLSRGEDGGLEVTATSDADTPLLAGATPLLVLDLWEHAYYVDYRNARARYVEAFWDLVDWQAAGQRFVDAG